MARKDKLEAAFSIITGEQSAKAKRAGQAKPLGVVLSADQIGQLDQIAAELGINRHKLMQYAIADFIRRYAAGERPKTKTETKEVLDI